jgi:ABC-type sulfate/molybdate transport systems ATPase subunit
VTHDPGEAAALASHIAVLGAGVVRQQGTTAAVFDSPADTRTARLLGYDNVLDPPDAARFGIPAATPIAFRAADLTVTADPDHGDAHVARSIPVAGASHVVVERQGVFATGISALPGGLPPGSRVRTRLTPERCVQVGATP